MTERGIRLSPQHGLNPAIPKCFYCLEDKNEILLPGLMKGDMEAPRGAVWDAEPCDKCNDYMRQGIILVSVSRRLTKDRKNPWRTGGFAVIKEEAVRDMLEGFEGLEDVLNRRFMFLEDEAWDAAGLPPVQPKAKEGG